MGFLAHIYVYMDAYHEAEADPAAFGKSLVDAIRRVSGLGGPVSLCVGCHGNGATVIGIKHADDETVLVHKGNCVVDVLSRDFEAFVKRSPEVAQEFLKSAEWSVKEARRRVWCAQQEAAGLKPKPPKPPRHYHKWYPITHQLVERTCKECGSTRRWNGKKWVVKPKKP
jgi:hypothetical protein